RPPGARCALAVSVDTWRASVAASAYDAGAVMGNDISGFGDPGYLGVAAAAGAAVVTTHIRLRPRLPDPEPCYDDVVGAVATFLRDRAARAEAAGIGVAGGCRIVRAHDVRGTRRVCDVVAAVLEAA